MRFLVMVLVVGMVAGLAVGGGSPGRVSASDPGDTSLYGTKDRLVISSIGVNAPVNTRNVGADGQMGNPVDWRDVVQYNFPNQPGYGGYPGSGGTTVLAGHVDYHDCGAGTPCTAVFWSLKQLSPGAEIDYYRADGSLVTYQVNWVSALGDDQDMSPYLQSVETEGMTLISCEGGITYDADHHAHYSSRTLVYATRTG